MEADSPWALVVAGVLDTRESRFAAALSALRIAAETLQREGDRDGLYQVLSITEWAEFWSGDCAASIATCYRALDCAATDAQRLHTLLSLLSAALDMRRWDTVASASARADEFLPRAKPEEAARAQALRAHAAFYRGDMRAARELIQSCHDPRQTAAQRAASLNTHGMIDIALGDYDSAARHLQEAASITEAFGQALASYMIEDNIAFLESSLGLHNLALPRLRELQRHADALDVSMLCFVLTHQATSLRRYGDLDAALEPASKAAQSVPPERDPYLAFNARANLALTQGLLGAEQREFLRLLSSDAAAAGVSFVELKAIMFGAILAETEGDSAESVALLEECLPRQLALGHINLVAQELCPRPALASRILRRHRSNGLGPALTEALSHHWLFAQTARTLKELGPSQVTTWTDRLDALRRSPQGRPEGAHRLPASGEARASGTSLDQLTAREHDVLELMAQDRSNEEIAAELFIAVSTVKTHINHILRKLDQTTRIGAVLEFQRLGPSPPGA
jgi:ATP/maltotriose-dependent transcriptional regulator MalT